MSKEFGEILEVDSRFARWREEFNTLQDELSGHGFSRQSRLGNHRDEVAERRGSGRKGRSAIDAALDYALTARSYEELHKAAWEALTDAEDQAALEISRLEVALATATEELNGMLESAATLPDGTKVFRSADGRIWSEDGRNVSHLEDHVLWTGKEPSWEQFQAQRDRVSGLTADLTAWQHYQITVLGKARGRLSDPDNPPSADELEDILTDIESKKPSEASASSEHGQDKLPPVETAPAANALPIPVS